MTIEEARQIGAAAKRLGTPVGTWLRQLGMREVARDEVGPNSPAEIRSMMAFLGRGRETKRSKRK